MINIHRNEELKDIEKDVESIRAINKGLQDIIRNQGEHLNVVSYNIEDTISECISAVEQLEQANYYTRGITTLGCCVAGGVIAGPIGVLVGIKSSVTLLGLTLGGGYLGYTAAKLL